MTTPEWHLNAACRDEDPELFFPDARDLTAVDRAKAVCRRCPAETACLDWALRVGDSHAVLGGTTEGERRELRRLGRVRAA